MQRLGRPRVTWSGRLGSYWSRGTTWPPERILIGSQPYVTVSATAYCPSNTKTSIVILRTVQKSVGAESRRNNVSNAPQPEILRHQKFKTSWDLIEAWACCIMHFQAFEFLLKIGSIGICQATKCSRILPRTGRPASRPAGTRPYWPTGRPRLASIGPIGPKTASGRSLAHCFAESRAWNEYILYTFVYSAFRCSLCVCTYVGVTRQLC